MVLFSERWSQRRRRAFGLAGAGICYFCCTSLWFSAAASEAPPNIFNNQIFDSYGEAGLIDMPTARFNPDGEISATFSANPTMERYNLGFQALPWLETVFRYSRLDRWEPNLDLYDRSLSIRIRLHQETEYWPAIAIGVRDVLGTGAFGAEYAVASKKIGNFDITAGLGWRRLGETAAFSNPLGWLFPSFKETRTGFSGSGGTPLLSQFFHGPKVGLIGGISWQTPVKGLQLIAELSGDKFEDQQRNGAIKISIPFNFGLSYQLWNSIQIGADYLYGTQFGVRVTIFDNAFNDAYPTRLGTQPLPVHERSPEVRNSVELDALQDATHFYANWHPPSQGKQQQQKSSRADSKPVTSSDLADLVFRPGSPLKFENAQAYGDSLILEGAPSTVAVSCNQLAPLIDAAAAAGFNQLVLTSSALAANERICSTDKSSIKNSYLQFVNDETTAPLDQVYSEKTITAVVNSPKSYQEEIKAKIVSDAIAQSTPILAFAMHDHEIEVAYGNGTYRTETEAVGRLLRVLMADAPDDIADFRLVSMMGTTPQRAFLFHRATIERLYETSGSSAELLRLSDISPVAEDDPLVENESFFKFPTFGWGISPGYKQTLFDPDAPYRFGIYADLQANVAFSRNFAVSGDFNLNIYNNFGSITRTSNSVLPHVRSDFVSYLKHGKNGIDSLMASYITKPFPDVFFLARAGYLESMFAGIGGEIYWQPPHERFSFGGALYAVRQRNFDKLFGFRHYEVITGHLSAYYQSPFYGLNFQLHVGRYLAGDYGATFEVTRRFDSGIEIGAYATLTNVPFSKFGEGSFDKGFIIHIPVDFLAPVNTQGQVSLDFSPLTRDGGQRLDGEQTLFYATRRASESEILPTWNEILQP